MHSPPIIGNRKLIALGAPCIPHLDQSIFIPPSQGSRTLVFKLKYI